MASTTFYSVKCACGHEGKIRLKENDTPYSADFWEDYSLIDLEGSSYRVAISKGWKDVFSHLKPACPICHAKLTEENLVL